MLNPKCSQPIGLPMVLCRRYFSTNNLFVALLGARCLLYPIPTQHAAVSGARHKLTLSNNEFCLRPLTSSSKVCCSRTSLQPSEPCRMCDIQVHLSLKASGQTSQDVRTHLRGCIYLGIHLSKLSFVVDLLPLTIAGTTPII